MSREKHTTPAWVAQLNEDTIVKDAEDTSWFSGGYFGMPTRFHSEGGYINAYDSGYHKGFHDETSLRTGSSVSSRRRRNSCCLALFLILAALLVAVGIGLMVYYLMKPDPTKYQAKLANGSLPLMNVPYHQEMKDSESQSFKNIEDSLCQKLDMIFKDSVYKDQYEYCKIQYLRLDDSPLPCACSNITDPAAPDNAKAYINLVFRGDVHRQIIHTIIEKHTRRVVGLDYDVLMIDDFIVDIESHLAVSTSTAKPLPDVGVRANLTIWVYNLTYTADLENRDSISFRELAGPFCNDLRRIFLTSELKSRFHSCKVQKFSPKPDIVITDVWFTGDDISDIETSVRHIILDSARKVNVSGQVRQMIGTLLITPKTGNDSNMGVVVIPLNPETTIAPTPSTRPPNWKDGMPYVELLLNFTGVDYNASLWDTSSDFFKYHAEKFCKEFERMILLSTWKQNYYECNMLNIYPPPSHQLYPYLRTVLHVTSNTRSPSELTDIIKEKADKYIFPGNLETYRIGDLYIILTDGQFSIYTTIYDIDTTFVMPTTTKVFPSIFTSYSFSTPTRSAGDTDVPPVSTIIIVYNATAAFIESHLIDFDYTPDLKDSSSMRFMLLEEKFCKDIDGYFSTSSLQRYYENCRILSFSPDPKFTFVLHFTAPRGEYLQTAVPSVIIQNAPKVQIGEYSALSIGGLNLLYDVFKFTVSATNHTFDKTPSILPTETMTMTTTMIPPVYSATLVNIFCDVASDISPEFGNRDTEKFRAQEKSFCKAISDIFNKDINTEFLDCYILQFSEDTSTVQFHAIFAEDATQKFGDLVVDMVHVLAKSVLFEQRYRLDIGGVMVEPYSCRMNVYPVNYTDPQTTLFTTLTPTTQVVLPTAGVQHCLRNPCKNGGTCVETMESYRCTCKSGFEGHDCETDVDECLTWAVACENGGTCKNKWGGHICECYPGYSGERCEIVQDRCASNPCKNGASCTGSLMQPCICASGWQGVTCEEDVDECKFVPSICKFNGICKNEIGSFTCECVNGRTGPTCNIGIDECTTIQPCRHGATCLDTDYSYKCVCKTGWTGENCTDDDDECSRDICENGGTCENTVGGFICNCTSGWTGPTCNSRYDECKGQNPCLHDGICVDTSSDFKCLCKEGWEGDICERDINECLDTSICNGHGTCENTDGGFRCECFLQWTGKLCDDDHDECTDTSLGQLCYNGGQCINQWGSYQCDCPDNWTGLDCRTDVNECGQDPPVCLHGGTCSNQDGGFICTCTSGWTGNRCQQDIDECLPPSPCQNNATCTNKVGSFICDCRPGWRGTLCDQDIDECKETPGVCRNGGLCYNEEGDYRCKCPDGIGGKNCDYSTDPCNDMLCAYGGTCYIDTNGDPKCNCTEQYQGENCMEDFDECTLYPCVYGTCLNVIGSFYCDCNDGFTGKLCDEDENECLFYQCVNGYCNNTVGSFRCECNDGWTGQFCNIDVSECSLLENPCNGNGRCQETPGSYKCDCYLGYSGQFCQDDFDECSQIQCLNDGVCHNFLGGYQCNCTQFWTGPFCGIDLNECTTLEKPCLNGGTCKNRNMGYDCLCAKQWKGDVCDEDVDECSETMGLCMNNGTCMNEEGGFKCNCTKGYTGELCQTEQDECLLFQPCENGGTCKNMPGSYECMCAEGFSGRNCEIDINECLENRCKNNAECKNEPPGDYTCVCVDGWTGKDCDIEVARCPDCQNGGICENKDNKFRCICSTGWEGNTCETDVDECAEVPSRCQNGGTCKNEQGDYSCICLPGYEGKNCETNIDECSSGPCLFGGTCNDGIDSYTCDCPGGRRGTNCEIDIDECVMMPCQHEGKCENTDGSFLCNCTVGWEGPLCETDKDECLMMRCLHGGTCKNTMGSFECENCDRGWEGQLCDIDVDECTVSSSSPCENGATCRNIDGWFECDCAKGWRGLNCSTDINECVELGASACFGNGNCTNVDGDYLCNCSLGYTGEKCGEDIDECKTGDICKNGAECLNNNGSFTCICIAPWEGPECDRVGPNTFDLSFETVGLTITQDLLDTQSEMFQRKQDILCQDISTFVTDYLIPYESCSIVNFQENPAGLTLRLSFDDNFPAGVGATQIKDLLFEFRDRLRFDDVYGIRVGDMVFKHSDFISTDVTMSKRLLNFTYTNDLENENSFAFQQYEGAFCTNVREIMMTNAVMFPNFTSCDVTDFTFDSGMDETSVTYTFEFEWTQNADEIAATFDDYIDKNLPKVYFDLYETAKVGDFYMYIRDMPSYTSVPMSFALLDVSWDPALGNNQSSLFSTYSVPFCKELSNLIQQHSSFVDNYGGCNVMSYRDQTTDQQLVSVDINLDLYEKLDPYSVKREVANIIYNNAPEERYNDNIGYRVSDLILYESLRTYFDIPYDGWVANFTFSLFDYSSYKPSLLNSSSAEFKAKQSMFCNGSPDGNQFIGLTPLPEGPYEQRFYTCFVHSYKFDELSLSDSLTSTVSLVFFGTDPILGDELWDMIKAPLTVFPVGGDDDYYLIGYDLVKLKSVDEIKVNVSDYFLDETTTTPLPDIAYVLRMRFPLLNFTSLEDYQNTSSFLYQNSSEWFCSDMSKMFDTTVTWLPKYAGCGNISFLQSLISEEGKTKNKPSHSFIIHCEALLSDCYDSEEGAETYINFELAFHETITNETEAVARLLSVITEKAKRATLPDLTVAIVLGPFMVFQDSLQPSITNPEIFRTPSPTTGRK